MASGSNTPNLDLEAMAAQAKGTFWTHLGAELVELTDERVIADLAIQPHHLNMAGILHGGVSTSLLDSIMGLLVMAKRPLETVLTTNLNVHFTAPVSSGRIRTTATIVHSGTRSYTAEGRVFDDVGNLCVFATGTFRAVRKEVDT